MSFQDKLQSIREVMSGGYKRPEENRVTELVTNLKSNHTALEYLFKRGLAQTTIEHFKLGYDDGKNAISIPVYKHGELVNIRYRSIDPESTKRYTQEKGCEVWLYNDDGISHGIDKGRILVVEGEFDLMSVWQTGVTNVISPASGKDSFGPWIELLDAVKQVYIAYDNDKPGKSAGIDMANRIGIDKCFEVTYPDGIKDANEYFMSHDKMEFKKLVEGAVPYYKHQFKGVGDIIEELREKNEPGIELHFFPYITFEDDWVAIMSGDSNSGKCHGAGTEILLHDGSIKKVEDIKVGDELMGPDSMPRKVLSLARGVENMYRIHERSEHYDVNESHIMSFKKNYMDKKGVTHRVVRNIPLKYYMSLSESTKKTYRGWKTGVEFGSQELDLDPYVLGIWLGDGTSAKPQITNMDSEILEVWQSYADTTSCHTNTYTQENNKAVMVDISNIRGNYNHMKEMLRKYNLYNNKHIPEKFKINSRENRLQLLAGIVDTDGSLANSGRGEYYEVTQKSKTLSDDIVFLARSLGFRVTTREKYVNGVCYYRMSIVGDLSAIPVKIPRKKSTFIPKKIWNTSNITVEPLGVGNYYGFTLEGDGLYCLGSFTVTHNTTWALNITDELLEMGMPVLLLPFERGVKVVGKRYLQVRYDKQQEDFQVMSDDEWDKIRDDAAPLPLYMSTPTEKDFPDTVRRAKRIFNIRAVVVDHLDYFIHGQDRSSKQADMMHLIKGLAEELQVIFFVVHHIKKPAGVVNLPPSKEDLKGSSDIYQIAEVVGLLHKKDDGQIDVIIDKNKGPQGTRTYSVNMATGKFQKGEYNNPHKYVPTSGDEDW